MLVIVSTSSASHSWYLHSSHHQHFIRLPGPQTRLGRLVITQSTPIMMSICWIYQSSNNWYCSLRHTLLPSHVPPLCRCGSGFISWVCFHIWISMHWLNLWKFLFHSIFLTYQALVLYAVLIIQNIMVCAIQLNRWVSVPTSQPF